MQRASHQAQEAAPAHAPRESNRTRGLISRRGIDSERYAGNQTALRRLSRTTPHVQCKLTIGAANDPLEAEADRVADQVMRMPDPAPSVSSSPNVVRRKCAECEEEDKKLQKKSAGQTETGGEAPPIVHDVLISPGQPLDVKTRAFFESRFGADLGSIRVHNDEAAGRSAQSVGATAYTVGRDVVFAQGRYQPQTGEGKKLLAHELTHSVQQGAAVPGGFPNSAKSVRRSPLTSGAYSLRLISDAGEQFIGPPGMDASVPDVPDEGAQDSPQQSGTVSAPGEAPKEEDVQPLPLVPNSADMQIQRTASFANPTVSPQDPLARFLQGLTPGLTTPTINGSVIANYQDVVKAITPSTVVQTGAGGGPVTCGFSGLTINTSAQQIVASNAPAGGWTATVAGPNVPANPAACSNVKQVPITMNALPSNADFVKRVQGSEDEHVAEIRTLHNRHFVPYDNFVSGLSGSGANLAACGANLSSQLASRNTQAALGFVFGYAATTKKLDGPGGTHEDSAVVSPGQNCASVAITLHQTNPTIAGSAPGNVVTVAPTVTSFNPKTLTVAGKDLKDGATVVKSFSTAANAQQALAVIQHYGMDSRNVIGGMEFFLSGGAAPHGAFTGVNEFAINPANYQVSREVIGSPDDWTISEVGTTATGVNINMIFNFGNQRNEAYSAWDKLQKLGVTQKCWVGGTRAAPEMMFFRA